MSSALRRHCLYAAAAANKALTLRNVLRITARDGTPPRAAYERAGSRKQAKNSAEQSRADEICSFFKQ